MRGISRLLGSNVSRHSVPPQKKSLRSVGDNLHTCVRLRENGPPRDTCATSAVYVCVCARVASVNGMAQIGSTSVTKFARKRAFATVANCRVLIRRGRQKNLADIVWLSLCVCVVPDVRNYKV